MTIQDFHTTLRKEVGAWISTLGGRRFLLTVGAGVVSSVLVYQGSITPEIYRDVVIATVAAYIAGNTYQKKGQNAIPTRPASELD